MLASASSARSNINLFLPILVSLFTPFFFGILVLEVEKVEGKINYWGLSIQLAPHECRHTFSLVVENNVVGDCRKQICLF